MPDMTWAPYMGQFFGQIAQALSGNNPGLSGAAGAVTGQGADMARNLEYQKMLDEQEKAAKKAKRGKLLGTLGAMGAALIPGVGPLVSAGLSAAGGIAGSSIGEGKLISPERMLSEDVLPAAAGFGIGKLGSAMKAGNVIGPAKFNAALKPSNFAARMGSAMSGKVGSQMMGRRLLGGMGDEEGGDVGGMDLGGMGGLMPLFLSMAMNGEL